MRFQVYLLTALLFFIPASASAQDYRPALDTVEQLKFDEVQVQGLFSLFLSRVPYMLDESADTEQMVRELAPQALKILRPEQRRILQDLAPTEELHRFGTMSRAERKRFVLDTAKGLVHPSKQEWLQRVEEMAD